jgi:tripartite-type tricarboxylate transporter receptor subunit TctC
MAALRGVRRQDPWCRWFALLALGIAFTSAPATAEDYPAHPIKLLVGFSAGGGLDISCRHWAQRLSARIGQPVVVENRPGASGELSVKQAMTSKPDGLTLVCLSASNTISSSKPNPPFDIRTDVVPVIQMTHFTFVLYVNPSLPVKTLRS